jgi:hypothetical protein
MKQIVNSYTYPDWPNVEIEYKKPIRLFIDSFQGYNSNEDSFKILYIKEAEAICKLRNETIKNQNKFDAIIAYDEEILKRCNNSYFLPFGTTWIHNYNFPNKKFQISNITGHKEITDGHILRKKVHYKQTKIINPIDFYISQYLGVENFNNNKILQDLKEPLFESQFHICIENSRQKNYFTEKLIDCFVTKTIPIYWGCPNIKDFFDISSIIIVDDLKDIINVCNNLSLESYNTMLLGIENNSVLSKKYINLVENVEKILQEILFNKI